MSYDADEYDNGDDFSTYDEYFFVCVLYTQKILCKTVS